MLKNLSNQYGTLAKSFHWIVALAIIGMIPFGWYMGDMERGPERAEMYGLHKSIGITVLLLMIARVCWRIYNGKLPRDNPAHPKWERMLANTVHALLYVCALAMPLTGWGMSSAGGHDVFWFGIPVPPLVEPNRELGGLFSSIHSAAAWAVISLVSLHILGALKHHFVDKDGTILRMFPGVTNTRDKA